MSKSEVNFIVKPSHGLMGRIRVPGDKSISHRAVMFGALAKGTTQISGFLEAEDCLATLNAFRAMGVEIYGPEEGLVTIQGTDMKGLEAPGEPLDVGNAGTAMRLLAGLMAAQPFDTILVGDESLNVRPMGRIIKPLTLMGAKIDATPAGTAPLHIHGNHPLQGIDYVLPMASAQVKSCVLLAGIYAQGCTRIIEPSPTRDHTERLLQGFGYTLQRNHTNNQVWLNGGGRLTACSIEVPADISSAAFFMVGASISRDSEIVLEHIGINPTRAGVIEILKLMGADIECLRERQVGGEPVADIVVRSAPLQGIHIPEDLVPSAIDEFPALFIAAACAEGQTQLTGAEELRVKETDRIQVMADGLRTLGVDVQPRSDGMVIKGGPLEGGEVDSRGDHRIAMAFAMAALRTKETVRILNCANVRTSFPGFVNSARNLGLNIHRD